MKELEGLIIEVSFELVIDDYEFSFISNFRWGCITSNVERIEKFHKSSFIYKFTDILESYHW